jgi:hypothetical protein
MEKRMDKMPEARRKDIRIAEPMEKIVSEKKSPMKFEPIKADTRQKISKESTDIRKFGDDRSHWESVRGQEKSDQQDMRQRGPSVTQPVERKGQVTTPTERRQPVTPSPEQKQPTVSPTERRQPVTPSPEQKQPTVSPTERRQPITPSPEQKQPTTSPTERRATDDSRQDNKGTQSERVNIPTPPIVGKREGVFRGPPSQPADEGKTDVKRTPRSNDSQSNSDASRRSETPRDNAPSRDRGGQQRGNRGK